MIKQKSKFNGLIKGAAIGFAFVLSTAFFPINAIASAVEDLTSATGVNVNSIKVNGKDADLTVTKGETVKIPTGEYVYKTAEGKGTHEIGSADTSTISSKVEVFYKATHDSIDVKSTENGKTFVADRVGRYTITYTVVEDGMEYSYDLTVKCEVSKAVFDFPAVDKNIIPSVYDTKYTNKDIVLPLPTVKDEDDEELITSEDSDYYTTSKDTITLPEGDEKNAFVQISLANNTNLISIKKNATTGEFYLAGSDLAKKELKGQELKVVYSYYQMTDGAPVFVSSTSKAFTIREGYYRLDSSKEWSESNKGYELETSWSTSTSNISAVVGVEKEIPKLTATTKSTNSPANEAVAVYYDIAVYKRGSNGKYDETKNLYNDLVTDGKFKAKEEGTYKFVYSVFDFYGNTLQTSKTSFEITNIKDTRSASVYVYDGLDASYNEKDNNYKSALNQLKSQSGNRNIIMYAVGGTDNMVDKDELTLRRTILDNTGVTMFNVNAETAAKAYNSYNLIFAPQKAEGASDSASVYVQIVSDNYALRSQMLLEDKNFDLTSEAAIKEFFKSHKYLLVTMDGKDLSGNTIVENFDEKSEESVKKMIEAGYAYVKPTNEKRKTFIDGTYTFIYGASDNINNETTSRYSVVVSSNYVDETVPTLNFTSDLQVAYQGNDVIEFNVATATDATSQDTRIEAVTAYRYLKADKTTAVKGSETTETLKYYVERVNSNIESKWYAKTNTVVENDGWYIDSSKSSYKINLANKPSEARYVEILAYAIDDYGNGGFFNKVIRIADVQDTRMPTLYKAVGVPESNEKFDAPSEITLPTLYFEDDNVDYMSAVVNVYKVVREGGNVVGKVAMQSSNMRTEFDTNRDSFMVKAGSFRASTAGEYQVAITVKDAGNNSFTTYFRYNVEGGEVFETPEIENITSETIEIEAGKAYYLVPPTLSINESEGYGYIGIGDDDDAKTATYYTTTILSSTDDYELTKYYFTGSKKGVFKLQYKVFLMQYSKDSKVFAASKAEAEASDGMIYLENGKLHYYKNGQDYFVFINPVEDEDGEIVDYVLGANTSLQGIGTELGSEEKKVLGEIVKVYTRESKIQTINVGGVEMDITLEDGIYKDSYETLGEKINIVKPNNIEYNGEGYQTNNDDSTVTITKTSGNTTTTLATLNFADWAKDVPENNTNFEVDEKGNVKLVLADNGRYVIRYSIQAMDKNGMNVGDAKTVEYAIKNGDVVAPELELGKNLVKAKYRLGDTMTINLAGITVNDAVTEDRNELLKTMNVRLKNTTQDSSYITLENEGNPEDGEYIFTKKLESAGSYTLTISIKDKAGNETSQSVSFEVSTDESKDINVKEVMGGVMIGISVALLAGVVIYFTVSKVKLDKKEKSYKDK